MAYVRKTYDEWVLLTNYGYGDGWEEVVTETTYEEIRKRLREYRENMPQYPYRIKKHRVPIKKYNIYSVRLNADTHNFGGMEWIVDGEIGRKNYPGSWAECTAREYYAKGWSYRHIVEV